MNTEPFTPSEWSTVLTRLVDRSPKRTSKKSRAITRTVSVTDEYDPGEALVSELKHEFADQPEFIQKYKKLHTLLTERRAGDVAVLFGLSHSHGGIRVHPGDTLRIDTEGRVVFTDALHGRAHVLINEHGELHPLGTR